MPVTVMQPDHLLSEHFTYGEMTYSATAQAYGIANDPNADNLMRLTTLCNRTLEPIRKLLGKPMLISSGYRNPEVNQLVGGAANSAHLFGCAADFECPEFGTPLDVCHAIIPHLKEFFIDQLIYEQTWVHVGRPTSLSTAPRYETLTIYKGVTIKGIS